MAGLSPFQLLEINLISAQDIAKVARSMRTYAVAWVHPDRKLTTRVDTQGVTNPTWNDKFVFRVDNQFLQSDTSAIMIEIYALHWFRDVHVGTVRVLVGNLIPPQTRTFNHNHLGMRFVALQVRRPSGRPQGILNVGVTVLDSTMRSMPLYTQLSTSAVGYQKLMGQDENHNNHPQDGELNVQKGLNQLRRVKSERSSILENEYDQGYIFPKPNNSIINGSENINEEYNKKGKHMFDKPLSIINGVEAGSNLSLAVKLKDQEAGSVWYESEIGPSPSEVAAAIAEDNKFKNFEERGSSIIMDYESEGVRTKLERWRSEMPMAYGYGGSYIDGGSSSSSSTIFPRTIHTRRYTADGGAGKFSCFGNICGYECSIVCGKNDEDDDNNKNGGGKAKNKYDARSPSLDSVSTYF
uniref:C2 domain-containing protein n=1 Tax=Chenopodium quinoa TaxID=63459 RepID=A0A803LS43_CHEQI